MTSQHDFPARFLIGKKRRQYTVANIKSQLKRIKTNEAARQRNKTVKSALKTSIRRTREALAAGDSAAAKVAFEETGRKLDKAAGAGVIHKNEAANKKSALAKQVNAL
jgi:small subunit ribosomal protein S20